MTPSTATRILALSAVGFGLVPFFARHLTDTGMASSAVTFYRWLLTALVLLPFLRFDKEKRPQTMWAIGSGVGLGLGWTAYVEALSKIHVSTVGVIYMTYPLFALLAGWILIRQRPGRRSLLGGALIAAASVIALSPAAVDTSQTAALIIAFAAPLSFGVAITVLTERLNRLNPLARIAAIAHGAIIGVMPIVVTLSPRQLLPKDPSDWWLIIGIGAITSLIPKIGYSTAAPFVGSARAATTGAIELPTIFLVGWIAFGEPIGAPQLIAGLLVLTSVLLTPTRPPTWDLEDKTTIRRRPETTRRHKVDNATPEVAVRTSKRPKPKGPQPSRPPDTRQNRLPARNVYRAQNRFAPPRKNRPTMSRPTADPKTPKSLTFSQQMRMTLGPGFQFIGPTENILTTVTCARFTGHTPVTTRYCQPRRSN